MSKPFSPGGPLRRARRFAVPRPMIVAATERRRAGDFRGALRAARVWPTFDLSEIARDHGAELRRAVEDALSHMAPDLLRWQLPRYGEAIEPNRNLVLAAWPARPVPLALWVATPTSLIAPQDVRLCFGPSPDTRQTRALHRGDWDVREVQHALARAGGRDRLPFFTRAGHRIETMGVARNPRPDPVTAPEEHFERVTELLATSSGYAEAAALCGFQLGFDPQRAYSEPLRNLALPLLLREARAARGASSVPDAFVRLGAGRSLVVRGLDGATPRLDLTTSFHESTIEIPPGACLRPPDLDLLRFGHLAIEELHPLLVKAWFPDWPGDVGATGPAPPEPFAPFRVRCGKDWHLISLRDGQLYTTEHSPQDAEREAVLGALGGPIRGCFHALQAWATPGKSGSLPKAMRLWRSEFCGRVFHGDVVGVFAMLDQDRSLALHGTGRSLLHELPWLGAEAHERVLGLGLDLEGRDLGGHTPLDVAETVECEPARVALLAAGAMPTTRKARRA